MTRKPMGRILRGGLWTGAILLVAIFAAMLLFPMKRDLTSDARDHPVSAADADGGGKEGTAGASSQRPHDGNAAKTAEPETHEDAIRRGGRAEAVGSDASRLEVVGGYTVLRLDTQTQEQSGLKSEVLAPVNLSPEIAAFARVVDIQLLLAQRARYTAAQAQADVARTTLAAAKNEYDRLEALNKQEGDIATKRIQQAEADWQRNQAELRGFETQTASIRDETRQQWGQVLTGWALDAASPEFERLLKHQDALLLVTLPPGQTLPPETDIVRIATGGDRAHAAPAAYVSPAPTTDPVVQGETHYFRSAAAGLRAGMRVDVWINQSKNAAQGVVVPQSAVVWALGQAWAYVRVDPVHFVRRPVSTATEAPGGWFVTDTIKPGDSVVVAGAQMLYAEEFRWQIHDEDNN